MKTDMDGERNVSERPGLAGGPPEASQSDRTRPSDVKGPAGVFEKREHFVMPATFATAGEEGRGEQEKAPGNVINGRETAISSPNSRDGGQWPEDITAQFYADAIARLHERAGLKEGIINVLSVMAMSYGPLA